MDNWAAFNMNNIACKPRTIISCYKIKNEKKVIIEIHEFMHIMSAKKKKKKKTTWNVYLA